VIAAPAVDLKGGRCVQLVGGRPEEERVSLPDPVAVARRWWDTGFRTLHLVDLDAALSTGHNRLLITELAGATEAEVQAGGGVRDGEVVEALLAAGADRVIVGTRAVDDPAWFAAAAGAHPGRLMVAADIRDGMVLRRGWTEASPLGILEFLERVDPLPLAGVLCTDVAKEGRMEGIDLEQAGEVIRGSRHPVWISGGIHTMQNLENLNAAGAAGVVLGMALYTGALDPAAVAREYGG